MTKLNIILFAIVLASALSVVTSQHRSRKLYIELQQQQDVARQYDIEWGQLQLEQSTWAMHARIEQIATGHLHMQVPDIARIQVVPPKAAQEIAGGAR
jgi:cell division protein FtsL